MSQDQGEGCFCFLKSALFLPLYEAFKRHTNNQLLAYAKIFSNKSVNKVLRGNTFQQKKKPNDLPKEIVKTKAALISYIGSAKQND
tara:strand:+ start:103 stop:360 length:258 start_codon:yes stop_codon:yes gene_type:complete